MTQETRNKPREPEHSHLRRFAKLCPHFPAGQLKFGDKPDLIVHTNRGDLGVEHTQLFRVEADRHAVLPQAQERLQDRVMACARMTCEERSGEMLALYAHFSPHSVLTRRSAEEVAARLADVVVHASDYASRNGQWHEIERWAYDQGFPGLFPAEIDLIHFQKVDKPGFVIWGVPRSCAVPEITADYLLIIFRRE